MTENTIGTIYKTSGAKILVLVPDLTLPGGVSNYYNTLKLDTEKYIHYFPVNKGGHHSTLSTAWRLFANYWRFIFLVVRNRYTLVHANPSLDRKSFYRDAMFVFLARFLGRKTLVFFRGWKDGFEAEIGKSAFKKFVFRLSYARAGKYIVLGEVFKTKLLALGVPATTEFFIETTVADSSSLDKLDLPSKNSSFEKNSIFLFLSRIEKDKGVYIAIDAFSEFLSKHPGRNSQLIIAGDGPELDSVKNYVARENVQGIEFTGHVKGERKNNLLLSSHVLLFPTYYGEGLPNSILESMLYGMPVVSRVTGAIPDIVHQNENGFLSDSMQPGVFANFLDQLASDNKLYRDVSLNNHRIAKERYTTEKVRERILKIYQGFN